MTSPLLFFLVVVGLEIWVIHTSYMSSHEEGGAQVGRASFGKPPGGMELTTTLFNLRIKTSKGIQTAGVLEPANIT